MAGETKYRGSTLDLPSWWATRAKAEAKARGLDQYELAELVKKASGREPSRSKISRCLNGFITEVDLVEHLSAILHVPRTRSTRTCAPN